MADASLPLFYRSLEPLSSEAHAGHRMRVQDTAPFLATQNAVPVTIDEFQLVQRYMPIVFSVGDEGIPLALMGLSEGINVFVDDAGKLIEPNFYVPAYVRRYPFLLARLTPDAEDLSLCFDATAYSVGDFADGAALFEDGQPSRSTRDILAFNETFEQAGQRTRAFMTQLRALDLLMDGEVSIQPEGADQPVLYRGFQMVSEETLNGLPADKLGGMAKSGLLTLVYAHLNSLSLMREIFKRQVQQSKQSDVTMPLLDR